MKRLLTNCTTASGQCNILIDNNIISYVGSEKPEHDELLDCTDLVVLPGMIDPHVHVRDLEAAYKETWKTASYAALAGGITTIMDMPNTIPATTSASGLEAKRKAAEDAYVRHYLHLGATTDNLDELRAILADNPADVVGIKVFLAGSSSNEVVTDPALLESVFQLAKEFNKVVLVHSEYQPVLDKWAAMAPEMEIEFHGMIRHREAAIEGTKLVLDLAQKVGNKLYLCHVSTQEELSLIEAAKAQCDHIYCEVTPHHLLLDDTMLKLVGNFGKVNPPLRAKADRLALIDALKRGVIDCLGSDHAPHSLDEKLQEYATAPSGIPGMETAIPMTYQLVADGEISLDAYYKLIAGNAAEIFGISNVGKIEPGYLADLAILDVHNFPPVISGFFQSKAKYSPFDGMSIAASLAYTIIDGEVYEK